MVSLLPVAVDAMGGDHAPSSAVQGALVAAAEFNVSSILVGDEKVLNATLLQLGAQPHLLSGKIAIHHADISVSMDEKPGFASRKKKNSSLHIACQLVKQGRAIGMLSAGNTGAVMAISMLELGRIEGVLRPAIAALLPNKTNHTLLIDVGANTVCTSTHLLQFALMGDVFMRHVYGIDQPHIGILANGEESSKGTVLTRATLELLQKTDLRVFGHCEGQDIVNGSVDVVVCDGFMGNVVLKAIEGTAGVILSLLKDAFAHSGPLTKMGGLLAKPAFRNLQTRLAPEKHAAAPLIGLRYPVYVSHGRSDAKTIAQAIVRVAKEAPHYDVEPLTNSLRRYAYLWADSKMTNKSL